MLVAILGSLDQHLSLILIDGRDIVPSWHDFRLNLFLVFVDNLVLCHGLNWLFYLQERMFMVDHLFAVAAEVEVVAKDALIANAQNAELVFAV